MEILSDSDKQCIADAIAAAEKQTSGEIVAVVARESSSYLFVPVLWAALVALLVPWPLIVFTWWSVQAIYITQLVVFLALLMALWPRPIRLALVPPSVKQLRAHRRAVDQFLAQNLHTTGSRTGVLIYVSEAERYAEILADSGIDAKVDKGTWQRIVDGMLVDISAGRAGDGFTNAIAAVGRELAAHFPPGTADPNELPDHLIVLD